MLAGHLTELGQLGLALLTLTGLGALGRAGLLALLSLGAGLLSHLPHLLALLSLAAGLLALLALAAGLRAHLPHLLALLSLAAHPLSLLPALALTHGVELGELRALAVGVALVVHPLSFIHLAALALAIGTAFGGHALAGTVHDHDRSAGTVAAGSATRPQARIKGVVNHIHRARAERGGFGHHVVAHLVHLDLVLAGVGLVINGAEKIGQILVLVADVEPLVGEFLVGEIDAGKLLFELLGIQFPGGLDGGGGEDHRVG